MKRYRKPNGFWTLKNCKKDALRFNFVSLWQDSSAGAYNKALDEGWLKYCTNHMKIFRHSYSKLNCLKDAKNYITRSDWANKSPNIYDKARREKWLDECCKHMPDPDNKRSLLDCQKVAQQFETRGAWYLGDQKTYSYAYTRGWLDECCKHMTGTRHIRWTLKSCKKDAKNYTSRRQWHLKSGGAYGVARINGWLDECCKHMTRKIKPANFWNKSNCREDASHYNSITDWRTNSSGAYSAALNQGFLKSCIGHMKKPSSGAKRFVYYFIDPVKRLAYVGLTMYLNIRGNNHLKNKKILKESLNKGNLEFYDLGLFSEKQSILLEASLILKFKSQGYSVLNKAKAGSLGGNIIKWNRENCIEDSKLHKTKKEWRINSSSAYQTACRKGWLSECKF